MFSLLFFIYGNSIRSAGDSANSPTFTQLVFPAALNESDASSSDSRRQPSGENARASMAARSSRRNQTLGFTHTAVEEWTAFGRIG